jgi:hypothetical protein
VSHILTLAAINPATENTRPRTAWRLFATLGGGPRHVGAGVRRSKGRRGRNKRPAGHNLISVITAGLSLQAVPFGDSVTLLSLARGVPDGQEQTSHVAGK